MNFENYFKDPLESLPDYKKIAFLMFLIKTDVDFLKECGFWKNDINRLSLELKNSLLKQNEDFSDYNKNEEESNIEKILNN